MVFWATIVLFLCHFHLTYQESRTGYNPFDPYFTSSMHNLTVSAGREAHLTCTVDNLGRHKVAWVRAEDQTVLSVETKVVTHNSRISVTQDNNRTWQLRIKSIKESDRGCYMCQINTSNIRSQQGCLDVQVPPDIIDNNTSGDLSVTEGDNVTLWCRATGHPAPRVIWRREDGQPINMRRAGNRELEIVDTFNGSNLYFLRSDRKQMGAYLCIASNDVPPAVSKRISLSVNFPPSVRVPNQLLGTPLRSDVLLSCHVEAFPNTINYWVKNRGEMLLNNSKYNIREEKHNYRTYMWLLIKNFSEYDVGTYNCIATNSLGKAEGTLRLYEIKVNTDGYEQNRVGSVGGLARTKGHKTSGSTTMIFATPLLLFFILAVLLKR
ncbi:lachesin-like isoform X1 [Onthophagus taurus]|uniref:lachesin-like isoform X1 n=2 Tax=Onthophagus taurus TaxID=166361 RepID=UPI0039BE7155